MAFQSKLVSAASPIVEPALPTVSVQEEFGEDLTRQMKRMVEDALRSITRNRAYFRESDITNFVLRSSEKEFANNPEIMEHLRFQELVESVIRDRPLITIGQTRYLSTPEMVEDERTMLQLAGEETDQHLISEQIVDRSLRSRPGISEEQTAAVMVACRTQRRVTVIEGAAGAGKSYTMLSIKEAYMASGYDVLGTALSWNAAKVLGESTGLGNCVAIEGLVQSMLKAREAGTEYFQSPTLMIVDEAGMVGTRHMVHLLRETARSRHPVKVVLTGDSLQVNPVDAGNALEAIIAFHGTTRIDTIRRQNQMSHRAAVKRFSQRRAGAALNTFMHQEALRWCKDQDALFNMVVRDFISYRHTYPDKKALILALRNKDVVELNQRIRRAYKKVGFIDAREVTVDVTDGRETWQSGFSVGDEVVLRANSKDLVVYSAGDCAHPTDDTHWAVERVGVFNRNAGRIVGIRRGQKPGSSDFVVDLTGDSGGRVIINSADFKHPERKGVPMVHNFATTIYASQGQTVQKVLLIDSPMMEFRLAYVGMSRHTEGVDVYLDETELHHRLDYARGRPSPRVGSGEPQPSTELGRYRRSEMLQAVALGWSKPAKNLTVTMFERTQRLGGSPDPDPAELATIAPLDPTENILDFIPDINVPVPPVDLEQLLSLPDPIVEQELVAPSTIDTTVIERRDHSAWTSHVPPSPDDRPPQAAVEESWFNKAVRWIRRDEDALTPKPSAIAAPAPVSAFSIASSPPPSSPSMAARALAAIGDAVSRAFQAPAVPMLSTAPPIGQITEQGMLSFDGVPQTPNPSTGPTGPTEAFLSQMRGRFWDVGQGGEPRILARSWKGDVVARYRLDGRCVVGEGFPPICLNPRGNPQTPICIVPGAKEWFWFTEHQQSRHGIDNPATPHVIWAAKDVDWAQVAPAMKGRQIRVVRSKHDLSQIPWAQQVARTLLEEYGVEVQILPPLPTAAATVTVNQTPTSTPLRRPGP